VTIEAHSGVIVSVSASAHYVVSASWNGEIKVWNLNDLHAEEALLANIEVGEGPIHAVSMSPDGRRAVSAALGGSLTVWSLRTGNMVCSLQGSKHDVTAMGMTPDGKRLVSGTRHGTLKLWSLHQAASFAHPPLQGLTERSPDGSNRST